MVLIKTKSVVSVSRTIRPTIEARCSYEIVLIEYIYNIYRTQKKKEKKFLLKKAGTDSSKRKHSYDHIL